MTELTPFLIGGGAVLVLLFLSAVFSGSETAIISLPASEVDDLPDQEGARGIAIAELHDDPTRFLVGVLLGNTLVNVAAVSAAVGLALSMCEIAHLPPWVAVLATVVIMPLALLVFGEVTPKSMAFSTPRRFALAGAPLIRAFFRLCSPVITMLHRLTRLGRFSGGPSPLKSPEEIRALLKVSDEEGLIDSDERELIGSAVELAETCAREIMVPRPDMTAIEVSSSHAEALDLIESAGLSRLPVYRETVDQIIGVLHAKDLLQFIHREDQFVLERVLRQAFFVPEAMNTIDLLQAMKGWHTQMAVVVDEYGGTSGLIALEDILEELVGEIWDEHDEEEVLHERIDEHTLVVDGRMSVADLSELIEVDLEGETYETVGGLILDRIGDIPKAGRVLRDRGIVFAVEKVVRNRIRTVRVTLPRPAEARATDGAPEHERSSGEAATEEAS